MSAVNSFGFAGFLSRRANSKGAVAGNTFHQYDLQSSVDLRPGRDGNL